MQPKKTNTLLLVLLVVAYPVLAQNIIPRFETLGVNDGLPHSSVYSILQDKKGYMWFGTPDGLCRYDGSILQSYKYKPAHEKQTINNFIRGKIKEDKNGNIWFSNESGIYHWNVLKQRIVLTLPFNASEYNNSQFSTADLDEQGNLWMINLVSGFISYNIETKQLKKFPLPHAIQTANIRYAYNTVDRENNIWLHVVTGTDPFLKFNKSTGLYSIELAKDPPHAIFFNKQKKVLAYEDRLVIQLANKKETVTIPKMINQKKIPFFSFDGVMDSHNRIWMTARGGGLFYYDEAKGIFHEYHHDNSKIKSLPFDLTTCLLVDRSDNLWIGTDGGGVAKIDLKQPRFNLFPLSEGDYPVLKDYFTKCFYEDEKGRIWFGSHNNGLSIYNPITSELINYKNNPFKENSLPGNVVASIYSDKSGNMWIGTNAGLSIFNEGSGSFSKIFIRNLPKLYPNVNLFVYKFIELKNGEFLVATFIGLVKVTKLPSGKYEGMFHGNDNFTSAVITDVAEMRDGTIFISLPGIGLYHVQPSKNGFNLLKTYFGGVDLRSIRIDEQDSDLLMVGSGKGLIELNTKTGKYIEWNEKSGLANSYVYGSLEDENHNLWISTNGGLSYLNRATNHIINYSYQDGLQSNEFNTQAFYKSPTNTFYFGGIKGFNWFQTNKVAGKTHKPQVAISKLSVNEIEFAIDSALSIQQEIKLAYDENNLIFEFSALDFTRPEANRIQYTLEGWEDIWITTSAKSTRYSNLPPGKYTMRVKASNASGIWSDEVHVNLLVQKPFWQQNWFYVLVALLVVLIIVFLTHAVVQSRVKKRLQNLEKQAAIDFERNRISKDMHDEIGNGLTHIALLSELIQLQHTPEISIQRDILAISKSASKLVQTMGEIIWALSPQNDTLDNLLAYIREQSQQYFEGLNISFVIDFPDVLPNVILTNEQRRNLFLVTKEALSNATKHANATQIHLSLLLTPDSYCFNVHDDGSGMPPGKLKVGNNGLKNMRKRMEDIGGSIEWINEKKGTRVEYCLPFSVSPQ